MIHIFNIRNPVYKHRAIMMNGALIKHLLPRPIPAPANDITTREGVGG